MIFGIDVVSMVLGGLAAGMVLFIVSVGLSVTMGLMGFVNLAHGGFAMLGGYVIVLTMRNWGIGFVPALAVGFVVIAGVSIAFERLLYSRLYRASELDQVLWAMCTRFDPNVDIDIIQKAWASKRDPLFLPGNFNNRMLVDACIPYDMKLKGTFPTVVDVSDDLRGKLRAKFPHIFPPLGA